MEIFLWVRGDISQDRYWLCVRFATRISGSVFTVSSVIYTVWESYKKDRNDVWMVAFYRFVEGDINSFQLMTERQIGLTDERIDWFFNNTKYLYQILWMKLPCLVMQSKYFQT